MIELVVDIYFVFGIYEYFYFFLKYYVSIICSEFFILKNLIGFISEKLLEDESEVIFCCLVNEFFVY